VGWGKVFVNKDIYTTAALDMSTGTELWSNKLSNVVTTGMDIAPLPYGGMVLTSTVPGTADIFYAPGGIGILYALDQATGKVVWQFNTCVDNTLWGHPEVNSCGGSWYPGAVDTNTGITYWGIGNPAPWPGTQTWPNGSSRPGPNLYNSSIVSLGSKDGKLNWYMQVLAHDLFDYDFQISPILASANINGVQQDVVIGAGKMGRVYAFNRSTGAILWVAVVGTHQNDQLASLPPGATTVEPGPLGGVETVMAYADGTVYATYNDLAIQYTPSSRGSLDINAGKGGLVAIEANTGKILWEQKFNALNVGAATVVNDLVLTGTYDGMIYAFNRTSGQQLWSYQAPARINGWPAVAGNTIVWPCGVGGSPSLIAFRPGATAPIVTINAPLNGSTLTTGNVTVTAAAFNFTLVDKLGKPNVAGEGHIHYFIDVDAPTTPGKPAVTAAGTYAATAATSYTWPSVPVGSHYFSVELVNNDHTPLSPPVVATVIVVAAASP